MNFWRKLLSPFRRQSNTPDFDLEPVGEIAARTAPAAGKDPKKVLAGKALVAQRGRDYMRKIGSRGGYATARKVTKVKV